MMTKAEMIKTLESGKWLRWADLTARRIEARFSDITYGDNEFVYIATDCPDESGVERVSHFIDAETLVDWIGDGNYEVA